MSILEELIGQTIDEKYCIEQKLGQGGMGAVYRATHIGTERPVALKVIAPEFMTNEEFIARFQREARAAGRLRHPNVVNVTDFGFARVAEGRLAYLVMEYLDGCNLGDLMEKQQKLPLGFVVDIIEQVCLAVELAHQQGIIHRDLKPDNIWLEPNGRGGYHAKVLDFGLAKLRNTISPVENRPETATRIPVRSNQSNQAPAVSSITIAQTPSGAHAQTTNNHNSDEEQTGIIVGDDEERTNVMPPRNGQREQLSDPDEEATGVMPARITGRDNNGRTAAVGGLTRIGAVLGTPLYMSPEQCFGDQLDARSDIYCLGVIVYEMLAGERPFAGSVSSLIQQHTTAMPPPIKAKRPDLPNSVAAIVMSALAKRPDERPATCTAFAKQLRVNAEGDLPIVNQANELHRKLKSLFVKTAAVTYLPFFITVALIVSLLAGTENSTSNLVHYLHYLFWPIFFFSGMAVREINIAASMLIVEQYYNSPHNRIRLTAIFQELLRRAPMLAATVLQGYANALIKLFLIVPGFHALVDNLLLAPVVIMEKLSGSAAQTRARQLANRVRPLAVNIEVRALFWSIFSAIWMPVFMFSISGRTFDIFFALKMNLALPLVVLCYMIGISIFSSKTVLAVNILYLKARETGGEAPITAANQKSDELVNPDRPQISYKQSLIFGAICLLLFIGVFVWRQDPMLNAILMDNESVIKSLLDAGADANVMVNQYHSALVMAIKHGNAKIVKMLIAGGADVNRVNKYGDTPLMYAAESGQTNIAHILIEAGADAKLHNNIGGTALMEAAESGSTDIAKLLLEAGVDINAKNNKGKTALDLAQAAENIDTAKFLQQAMKK